VLLNKDLRAERYIKRHQAMAVPDTAPASGKPEEKKVLGTGEKLKKAIIEGDEDNIVPLVEAALAEGWDPIRISNEGLVPGLEEVGRLFACNAYYLPQVMLSADTMKKAFARLKKELKGKTGPTPQSACHGRGRHTRHRENIVATLLKTTASRSDLGKMCPQTG
jgi:5-methyltetrahydrofolate--homocysteine methyltransferase